jgi:hypothetical protein
MLKVAQGHSSGENPSITYKNQAWVEEGFPMASGWQSALYDKMILNGNDDFKTHHV